MALAQRTSCSINYSCPMSCAEGTKWNKSSNCHF